MAPTDTSGSTTTPAASVVHTAARGAAAHVLAARGGAEGLAEDVRRDLADRPCRPASGSITVKTETAADGFVRATGQVECADPGCVLAHEVRVRGEMLTAMLEATRDLVVEAGDQALALRGAPADGPAVWDDYQKMTAVALRGLIIALEPFAAPQETTLSGTSYILHSADFSGSGTFLRDRYGDDEAVEEALRQAVIAGAPCRLASPYSKPLTFSRRDDGKGCMTASAETECTDLRCMPQRPFVSKFGIGRAER